MEKKRRTEAAYYQKNKAKKDAQAKAWVAANRVRSRELGRARSQKYRNEHREKYLADKRSRNFANREKNRLAAAAVRALFPEKNLLACQKWRKANPEKFREIMADAHALRCSRVRAASVPLTEKECSEIRALYHRRDELTRLTGVVHHVDHVIPLARGGKHHPSNLQILTATENLRKGCRVQHIA